MEEGKLFQIGDVAKMFHISTGSLRHYEQAGLIQPEYIDPNTGYRYYSIRQFEVLNTIRYLRVLDMPLHQIADFLENRDIEVMEEKLLKQKELVAGKKKELAAIEKKIDHRLQQIRDARNRKLDSIQLIKVPSCRIVWLQDSLKPESYLDLEYVLSCFLSFSSLYFLVPGIYMHIRHGTLSRHFVLIYNKNPGLPD